MHCILETWAKQLATNSPLSWFCQLDCSATSFTMRICELSVLSAQGIDDHKFLLSFCGKQLSHRHHFDLIFKKSLQCSCSYQKQQGHRNQPNIKIGSNKALLRSGLTVRFHRCPSNEKVKKFNCINRQKPKPRSILNYEKKCNLPRITYITKYFGKDRKLHYIK